jgi:cold-inducible RNA-binding protein
MSNDNRITIYVGNAPYNTSEQELRDLFAPRAIKRVSIIMNPDTNKPKGFSFVEFATAAEADSAVKAFDGTEFGGRTLKIAVARERPSSSGGGNQRSGGKRAGGGKRSEQPREKSKKRGGARRDDDYSRVWKD